MTAFDTNVLIDLGFGPPDIVERILTAIEKAGSTGPDVVCGVVYAEFCADPVHSSDEVDAVLTSAQIAVDTVTALEVWRAAGIAYAAHQRRRASSGSATPRRIIADFIIGAHACTVGALVTSDADFYRRAFPDLRVIDVRSP